MTVFISYARSDTLPEGEASAWEGNLRSWARRPRAPLEVPPTWAGLLIAFLAYHGVDCWYDKESMRSGVVPSNLRKGVEKSDQFVLLWSKASDESEWVEWEVKHAKELGRHIHVVSLDGTGLEEAGPKPALRALLGSSDGHLHVIDWRAHSAGPEWGLSALDKLLDCVYEHRPQPPTIVRILAADRSAVIEFTPAPEGEGDRPIERYEYSLDGGAWERIVSDLPPSPVVVNGLKNRSKAYKVRLRAVSAVGVGAPSNEREVWPKPLGAPTIEGLTYEDRSILVNFRPPPSNAVDHYQYSLNGAEWKKLDKLVSRGTGDLRGTFRRGPRGGGLCEVKLRAVYADKGGLESDPSEVEVPRREPLHLLLVLGVVLLLLATTIAIVTRVGNPPVDNPEGDKGDVVSENHACEDVNNARILVAATTEKVDVVKDFAAAYNKSLDAQGCVIVEARGSATTAKVFSNPDAEDDWKSLGFKEEGGSKQEIYPTVWWPSSSAWRYYPGMSDWFGTLEKFIYTPLVLAVDPKTMGTDLSVTWSELASQLKGGATVGRTSPFNSTAGLLYLFGEFCTAVDQEKTSANQSGQNRVCFLDKNDVVDAEKAVEDIEVSTAHITKTTDDYFRIQASKKDAYSNYVPVEGVSIPLYNKGCRNPVARGSTSKTDPDECVSDKTPLLELTELNMENYQLISDNPYIILRDRAEIINAPKVGSEFFPTAEQVGIAKDFLAFVKGERAEKDFEDAGFKIGDPEAAFDFNLENMSAVLSSYNAVRPRFNMSILVDNSPLMSTEKCRLPVGIPVGKEEQMTASCWEAVSKFVENSWNTDRYSLAFGDGVNGVSSDSVTIEPLYATDPTVIPPPLVPSGNIPPIPDAVDTFFNAAPLSTPSVQVRPFAAMEKYWSLAVEDVEQGQLNALVLMVAKSESSEEDKLDADKLSSEIVQECSDGKSCIPVFVYYMGLDKNTVSEDEGMFCKLSEVAVKSGGRAMWVQNQDMISQLLNDTFINYSLPTRWQEGESGMNPEPVINTPESGTVCSARD